MQRKAEAPIVAAQVTLGLAVAVARAARVSVQLEQLGDPMHRPAQLAIRLKSASVDELQAVFELGDRCKVAVAVQQLNGRLGCGDELHDVIDTRWLPHFEIRPNGGSDKAMHAHDMVIDAGGQQAQFDQQPMSGRRIEVRRERSDRGERLMIWR